jgi:outer membrane protein
MNRRLFLLATILTVWLSGSVFAQATNAVKIGVLNVFRVIAECAEGKQANDEFQRKFEAKKEELAKKQRELQDLQQQLQSQSRTLNDESRTALSKSIDAKTIDLKRAQEDGDKEFTGLRNQIFNRIGNKLAPIVQQYAKEYGYTFILDSSNQATQVVYSDPAIEITDDIVKRLDASQTSSKTAAPVGLKAPGPSDNKAN